MVHIQWYIL